MNEQLFASLRQSSEQYRKRAQIDFLPNQPPSVSQVLRNAFRGLPEVEGPMWLATVVDHWCSGEWEQLQGLCLGVKAQMLPEVCRLTLYEPPIHTLPYSLVWSCTDDGSSGQDERLFVITSPDASKLNPYRSALRAVIETRGFLSETIHKKYQMDGDAICFRRPHAAVAA